MAKKLGKKARKFAKKNLQSVMKRKRKLNSFFKKKSAPRRVVNDNSAEESKKLQHAQQIEGGPEGMIPDGAFFDNHLGAIFNKEDDGYDLIEDVSDSDGYLSEDPECPYISGSEDESSKDKNNNIPLLEPNREIHQELANQKSKLDRLCAKDPKFSKFLESRKSDLHKSRSEEIYSDEEGDATMDGGNIQENGTSHGGKVLTSSTVDVWCWLVMEEPNVSALKNLLNAFRAACHYGVDSNDVSPKKIANREVFSKILKFVLHEADGIFRRILGISGSLNKDNISKMANKSEWKSVRPLIKSFLRNSLFLLNQETDNQVLMVVLSQLRPSVMFFAAFPSLAKRLIKMSIHLWATGDENLSVCSFLIIRDIAAKFSSDYLDTCLMKTYGTFIANCKYMEPASLKRIEFLELSTVELYSLDIQKSYQKVLASVQQLASILRRALKTKKKDELKRVHSWQYIYCISVWIKFVSCNFKNYDLQTLLLLIIGVVKGVVHLFPGPRYLPLRFKCVKMLNQLSLSCGVFIPVSSLLFDCLEHRGNINADRTQQKHVDLSLILKVPKQLLKSRDYHERSILSAIQLLSEHFSQWCYHVSFPELATIPIILLKRFYEDSTIESVRRPIKRLIDQVQQNSDFIERKRDEASFSPKDEPSVDSFLQLEKNDKSAPFRTFYASIIQASLSRNAPR